MIGPAEVALVGKWRGRIELSTAYRETDGRKLAWENMKKYYRNMFDPTIVSVPLLFSHGRQLIPSLYFVNPVVEVTALRRGWERRAKILEAVDSMVMEKIRLKEQLKLIIQDTFLYDYGVRKVGYDAEFGYDPTGSIMKELMKELGVDLPDEKAVEFNTYILSEFPFFVRVPPMRFLVDPDTEGPGLETSRYVVEEFYRPVEDVLEDDRYEINEKDKLVPSHQIQTFGNRVVVSPVTYKQPGAGQTGTNAKSDLDRLKLYEVWDKVEKRVMVLADGYPGFLREQKDEWNLANFFPYDKLCFNPVSDEHYSVSDAMYIERQQVELNDIRTQEMYHRRKENLKLLTSKGFLSQEAKGKIEKGTIGPIVETNAPMGQVGANIYALVPNMSRDIFMAANDVREDIREILAFGRNQLGVEMGRRKTATEAMVIKESVELRSDERRDIVADFVTRSIHDINRLIFKFWDTNDVIRLTGPEGAEWQSWNGQFLEGEYALRILSNSTLPSTKQQYQQKVGALSQKYLGHPLINQYELIRLELDSYEEFDTSRLLTQQPNYNQPLDFRPGQRKEEESQVPSEAQPQITTSPGQQQPGQQPPGNGGGGNQ